jgi:hypothetical protein
MARNPGLDMSARSLAMGIGFVLIGLVIAYGLIGYLVPGLPQPVLGGIGGAIGVAAWLSYLRKRSD